jgi:hypothetical protein
MTKSVVGIVDDRAQAERAISNLQTAGIPELEARRYEGKLRGGNILVAVHTEGGDQQIAAEWALKQSGAQDVSATTESSVPKS